MITRKRLVTRDVRARKEEEGQEKTLQRGMLKGPTNGEKVGDHQRENPWVLCFSYKNREARGGPSLSDKIPQFPRIDVQPLIDPSGEYFR